MSVKESEVELNNEEFTCLVMRECGTRFWSGQTSDEHQRRCRFCAGILFAKSDLERWDMVLDENGRPVPREEGKNVEEA